MSARLKKVPGERGLYRDPNTGIYYVRIQFGGRDTYKSLETRLKRQALDALDARRQAKVAAKFGLALEPDASARSLTVSELLKLYEEAGFPDKRGRARKEGLYRSAQKDYCATLKEFFRDTLIDDLRPKLLSQYHNWRVENVSTGKGHRTTDLELTTLSNGLTWALQQEMVADNPIRFRIRFQSANESRHCREMSPANSDELHDIGRLLFKDRRKEALGWQLLFEGLTGLRTQEALSMRFDARPDEPGGMTDDGGSLCVRRCKKAGRDNPYVEVHEGLQQLLAAHKNWHNRRFPKSPWFFPGRDHSGQKPTSKGALTAVLRLLHKNKKLEKQFTSHGMRAFYVLVRRSQGATDTQITWEINHVGGVGTLEKVYGSAPPHWSNGKGPKLSWMPKSEPAWSAIQWDKVEKESDSGTQSQAGAQANSSSTSTSGRCQRADGDDASHS